MPTTKSARKRMRSSLKARTSNRDTRGRIMTSYRALNKSVAGGNIEEYDKAMRVYFSVLDKAAKKGVIKRNTADRRKSNAMRRRATLAKPTA